MAEQDKKVEKPVVAQQVDEQPTVQEEYFKDLLDDDEELNELARTKPSEEQLRKNKDAEEARKRREAEAKQKKEAEAKPKTVEQPAPANKPATAEAKTEQPAEPATDPKAEQVNKLGEQLVQFKQKYPNVDLANLDGDKGFKRFIDGKLMGKKDFTKLYEEYQEFRNEMGLQAQVQNNQIKSQASTGSPVSNATAGADVYSEEELNRLSQRIPFMNPKEAAKIEAKLKRSIQYYDNKK